MKMIHYVDNLEVIPITRNGVDSATHSPTQHSFCGFTIKVEKRNEFATSINGRGAITCEKCIKKLQERDDNPFSCNRCKETLIHEDIIELRNTDMEVLCLKCKPLQHKIENEQDYPEVLEVRESKKREIKRLSIFMIIMGLITIIVSVKAYDIDRFGSLILLLIGSSLILVVVFVKLFIKEK